MLRQNFICFNFLYNIIVKGIIVQKNNKRSSIFSCDLFDELSRKKLKFEIDKIKNQDVEKIVEAYSQFIMKNIQLF